MVGSWLLDLTAIALTEDPKLERYTGFVQDSGEGRWTVQAAIDEAVPADVLTAALFARFRSRQEHTFAEKCSRPCASSSAATSSRRASEAHSPHMTQARPEELFTGSTRQLMEKIHTAAQDVSGLVNPAAAPVGRARSSSSARPGDLTKRKLIPALYNLAASRLLSDDVAFVVGRARGHGRRGLPRQAWPRTLATYATGKVDPAVRDWLLDAHLLRHRRLRRPGDLRAPRRRSSRRSTRSTARAATASSTSPPRPSSRSSRASARRAAQRGRRADAKRRTERPLAPRDRREALRHAISTSARALNQELRRTLREEQIYRIDHYLGKETVQNILVFRFANGIFEPIWNRRYIDHVQITVAETIGVESRGGYYDTAGALRDMVPNHIFQLLSLVAMEPPISFDADAVRDEKAKVLRAIQPMTPRGRAHAGRARPVRRGHGGRRDGRRPTAPSRRSTPHSNTETFAALKLSVDNWRWADVPFYLRTGKRLARRVTEIAIQFQRPPTLLFRNTPVEHLSRQPCS